MRRSAQPSRRAGRVCSLLLSLVLKGLAALLLLWRTMWFALFCYKFCWEAAFHHLQQGCSAAALWLEGPGDTQDDDQLLSPPEAPRPQGAGAQMLEEKVQQLQESSSKAVGRLAELEASVQYLGQELCSEKLLWSSRYLELLREQQGLLVQLQRQDRLHWWAEAEGAGRGLADQRPWSPAAKWTDG